MRSRRRKAHRRAFQPIPVRCRGRPLSLGIHRKKNIDALTDHYVGLGMRDVFGRLPRCMGSGKPRARNPRAAGRKPDRIRYLNHRRRSDHHSCRRVFRHARHLMASGLKRRCRYVSISESPKGHRKLRGEGRRQALLPHASVRRGRNCKRHRHGRDLPFCNRD